MQSTLAQLIDQRNLSISEERQLVRMADISLRCEPWALQRLSKSMANDKAYKKVVGDLEDASYMLHPFDYFHDLFLALFRPVPALRDSIETIMKSLHLVPNQFVVTHPGLVSGSSLREVWKCDRPRTLRVECCRLWLVYLSRYTCFCSIGCLGIETSGYGVRSPSSWSESRKR